MSTLASNISDDYPSIESAARFGGAIGGGVHFGLININLEFGAFGIKDNDSFAQFTTQGVQESSTTGFFATPGIGINAENERVFGNLNIGYTFVGANRSIENCADCDTESISLENGISMRPKFGVFVNDKIYLSASYEHYFSKHLGSLLLVGFGARIRK